MQFFYLRKTNLKKLTKSENYRKIRDHFHCTGKYRYAVHSISNLKSNVPNEIPAVFHNNSNYDDLFITKKLINKS